VVAKIDRLQGEQAATWLTEVGTGRHPIALTVKRPSSSSQPDIIQSLQE